MNRKRSIAVLLAATLAGFGITIVVPGVASADDLGGVITADINNDGIPDHIQLGDIGGPQSTTCTVTVSPGESDGGFRPSQVHTYESAEAQGPFCPDLGVAMKLGNERRPDLVTAMSFGFDDLIVLHDFRPVATFHGIIQPTWLRIADLNGDGRPDLLEASGEEGGIDSLLNTPQRTLVPGPIRECTLVNPVRNLPQYVLADFNGDGGQDMLLSDDCVNFPPALRAEVLFGNGQAPVVLASTTDVNAHWTVFSIDLDVDGVPDAGVIETSSTGVTTVQFFHNDGHGNFTEVPAP